MSTRGLRGAITVEEDTQDAILGATRVLLERLVKENPGLVAEEVAAVFFTATEDLKAAYPAQAARQMGWTETALTCDQEMRVEGGLSRCIRVLVLWNTERGQQEVRHVYLRGARHLRPEWGMDED
jgi:chorismate mutase